MLKKKVVFLTVFVFLLGLGFYFFSDKYLTDQIDFSPFNESPSTLLKYDFEYKSSGNLNFQGVLGDKYKLDIKGELHFDIVDKLYSNEAKLFEAFIALKNISGLFRIAGEDYEPSNFGLIEGRVLFTDHLEVRGFKPGDGVSKISANILKIVSSVMLTSFEGLSFFPFSFNKIDYSFWGEIESRYELLSSREKLNNFDGRTIKLKRIIKGEPNGSFEIVLGVKPLVPLLVKGSIVSSKLKNDIETEFKSDIKLVFKSKTSSLSKLKSMLSLDDVNQKNLLPDNELTFDEEKKFLVNILGNLTYEDLMVLVEELDGSNKELYTSIFLKFKAYIVLNDDLSKISELLEKADLNSSVMEIIIGAIASSKSEAALNILKNSLEKRSSETQLLQRYLPSLVLGGVLTDEVEKFLRNLSSDSRREVSTTADLALSVAANKLDEGDERKTRLVNRAINNFKEANNLDDKRVRLLELGNTGSEDIIGPITEMLDSDNPDIRADALFQLRFVPGRKADDLLLNNLDSDFYSIRYNISRAFLFRTPSKEVLKKIISVFSKEKNSKIRLNLLKVIWNGRDEDSSVRSFVEKLSKGAGNDSVTLLAKKLIF